MLWGEGHSAVGWGIGGSVELQTAGSAGPKSIFLGKWLPLIITLHCLKLVPVSMPLRILCMLSC